ncbi:nitroreductase family protein [Peptostreptococcus stomatis]
MNFKELVKSNRTCRRYDGTKSITRQDLLDLVDLVRYAPCGKNKQALRFALVADEETKAKVFDNIFWAGYLRDWDGPVEGERPGGYILAFEDSNYGKAMTEDIGIAAQTLGLGARAEGKAVCIFRAYRENEIKEALGLGDNLKLVLVVAVGYPLEEVVIDDIHEGDDIKYYRDQDQVHHVPKIVTEDLLINK